MKRKGYYLCSLLVMIFVFLSCRDEEQDCTQAMQDIQNQLKENDLLKSVSQEREQCVLLFESNKVIFPQELIQNVDVDADLLIIICPELPLSHRSIICRW